MLAVSVLLPTSALVHFAGYRQPADAAASLRAHRQRAPTCAVTLEENPFAIANPGKFSRDERLRSRYGGFVYEPEGGWDVAADDSFSYDDLQASMIEIASFTRGDTTKGEVIAFEPNGALVDIGVKAAAYCTVSPPHAPATRRLCTPSGGP